MTGFDYIIIGSGTAGATLAARLSKDEAAQVLVPESGDPNPGIAGRQMDCPRGRVVGGPSSINGLIYMRGQHADYDDCETLGSDGWSFRDVLPHFRAIETYNGQPSQFRRAHGLLQGLWHDSAATAFLRPAPQRPILTLKTHAHVTSVTFNGARANGN